MEITGTKLGIAVYCERARQASYPPKFKETFKGLFFMYKFTFVTNLYKIRVKKNVQILVQRNRRLTLRLHTHF